MQKHARRIYAHPYTHTVHASVWQRLHAVVALPSIAIIAAVVLLQFFSANLSAGFDTISYRDLLGAIGSSLSRMVIAYIASLLVALPIVLLIRTNTLVERIVLPLFDIAQSVPVLAFFPVIILFFVRFDFLNGAAIFIIFLSMLWNIVFNVLSGIAGIPTEILWAARVYRVRGFALVRQILLPSVFPSAVTGSLLAWAQGWNIIIVAEVLHMYIPGGVRSQDLFGIGSILVNAASYGHSGIFTAAMACIVATIALMNFFVWQKLLHYAQRYRFE